MGMKKRKISADTPDTDNHEWTGEEVACARPALEVLPQIFSKECAEALLTTDDRQTSLAEVRQQFIAEHPAAR